MTRRPSYQIRWTGSTVVGSCFLVAAIGSFAFLELTPRDLIPDGGGLDVGMRFLSRAFSPALDYESDVPPWTPPLLWKAVVAAHTTILFATAAISIAIVGAMCLSFIASTSWWIGDSARGEISRLRQLVHVALYAGVRTAIACLRSVHELLWAVVLLAAFGRSELAVVVAMMIPYTGVLAKVFSEILDETPRDAAAALREAGASHVQVVVFGLVTRALPDMAAYTCYRFECAIRSSAVMGFFGIPTLGYYLTASFDNLHFGEVWTYLYVLFALILVVDWWSGVVRRRLVV